MKGRNDTDLLSLENFYLILFQYDSLYQKGCHLITGRIVKGLLSLEHVSLILIEYENKCWFMQRGWQFSCHLITGSNVRDISPENCLPHIVLARMFFTKRVAVQLPPSDR